MKVTTSDQARLIQAVRNTLLRACSHQLVNNLLRADDIRLVGTTCCEVGLINLVLDFNVFDVTLSVYPHRAG